jgi:tetratricopeptide (TPR) repeat protein
MKLYNDALKDYETAIKITPYYKEVFDARGEMLLKMGKEEEAKMDFDKVLQLSGTYF